MWLRNRSKPKRPRLTVSIQTKNSESRLGRLLEEVGSFADEIVVGVDADSDDRTLEVAASNADIIYKFRHPGIFSPVRFLRFDYATGDWILSLDDDESIDESFDDMIPELLSDPRPTHYLFPRKYIVNLQPCEYLYDSVWNPNWTKRLFRNDRRLFWKPPRVHTDSYIQGLGYYEERVSILHFESLHCSPDRRQEKMDFYRRAGANEQDEVYYHPPTDANRRRTVLRNPKPPLKKRSGLVHSEIRELKVAPHPNWRFELLNENLPARVEINGTIKAEIEVKNLGHYWSPCLGTWPRLSLSYHLLDAQGSMVSYDNPRFAVLRPVDTGKSLTFLCTFVAPGIAGNYQLEWDMVNDGECWFADLGGATYRTSIEVF